MPRWKALPEELDPQVREFTSQLRRLVDRSGLSISAVSDHTGYSKTSWERYLNGRLLAPKRAIVALGEATGTNPVHLLTMWELAERAWSRSEMRHDMTMEAIRISQARAALGEFGSAGGPGASRTAAPVGPPSRREQGSGAGSGAYGSESDASADSDRSPHVPQQPGPGERHSAPAGPPGVPRSSRSANGSRGGPGKRKVTLFLTGVVGALLVIAAAVLLTDLGGGGDDKKPVAKTPATAPTTSGPELPAGVKCTGADCTGQDPEAMGCGGELATTVSTATVGTAKVEVRYSKVCAAAWARITQAAVGDTVQISVDGKGAQNGLVNADNDAYTPMTAAKASTDAKACATLKAAGTKGCTTAE
ncbi:DUF2690 domain-containing protein [Streptomyces sp. NPDC051907]|uniref:helix-turn-helix domain-containing protein n=1 Tax=Streptomyces sp. NPDC051907 TaxID=3155284 RepID=UPI0034162D35